MVDIATKKHGVAFPSKIISGLGGGHIYNVTLAKAHDNGELVLRGGWRSLDNYDENTGKITFAGVIRDRSAEGGYYVEVTAATDALFVYNTPHSPYSERELKDDHLFYNAEGDVVRAYSLVPGDVFSVSEELFKGKIAIGSAVTFADGKYVIGATA